VGHKTLTQSVQVYETSIQKYNNTHTLYAFILIVISTLHMETFVNYCN